jgi:hypothetical protein
VINHVARRSVLGAPDKRHRAQILRLCRTEERLNRQARRIGADGLITRRGWALRRAAARGETEQKYDQTLHDVTPV